jgi:hypothetical protein
MIKKVIYLLPVITLTLLYSSPVLADTLPSRHNSISTHTGLFNSHHWRNPVTGTTNSSSENWAGYAVTGNNGSFNSVSSSWVQPSVNCSAVAGDSYSSYWVGLDGFSSNTVEQIGTEADCINQQAYYNAWYEMYPSNPYELSLRLNVNPGNQMSASVTYTPAAMKTVYRNGHKYLSSTPANFKLALTDNTTGQSYSTTVNARPTYARSSAEVITEAPYSGGILPLADFNLANYSSSTVNGTPMGAYANLQDITMVNPAGMLATPTLFDSTNENFSVNWTK